MEPLVNDNTILLNVVPSIKYRCVTDGQTTHTQRSAAAAITAHGCCYADNHDKPQYDASALFTTLVAV